MNRSKWSNRVMKDVRYGKEFLRRFRPSISKRKREVTKPVSNIDE